MNSNFYPVQAPVISHADPAFESADVIGEAKTAAEALAILSAWYAGTGAMPNGVIKAQPDRRGGGGPVDAWVPTFDE